MKTFFLLLSIPVIVAACDHSTVREYKKLTEKELSEGKRVDSIFFGLHFGMTSKQFFMHCWNMNKKGLFTDGANNRAVLYRLNHHELKHPGSMNFYPDFYKDRIYKMKVTFQYDAWAPWNKHLHADSLLPDVLRFYRQWYHTGNPFIKLEDEKKRTIYVKVDGNRRITIGKFDEMHVKADYTDLLTEKLLNQ